jgi:glycosyltransferase involved in cell wall biosynthesis
VDLFLPVSEYYRGFMPGYLGIPREKMRVVPLGINMEGYGPRPARRDPPFTVGYLARIAPEKGLHVLCEAYRVLRQREPVLAARLVAAGYLPPEHQPYLDEIRRKMREWGLEKEFEYRGEVDRAQKTAFLQSVDVFSVPATYEEPKGMFLLEALANGVPVVQPKRGAFPEIVNKTGGGVIVPAGDNAALADAWWDLWRNPEKAFALGRAGAQGVREHYDVGVMAEAVEQAYGSLVATH